MLLCLAMANAAPCSLRCEAEYTKGCMSHDQMCHNSCWQKLVDGSLSSCVRGCTPTRLMMTARCISNPDASLPTEMAAAFAPGSWPNMPLDSYRLKLDATAIDQDGYAQTVAPGQRTALCVRGAVSPRTGHIRDSLRGVSARSGLPRDYVSFPAVARAYKLHIVRANAPRWTVDVFLHSWHLDIAAELIHEFEPKRALIEDQSPTLKEAWKAILSRQGVPHWDNSAMGQVAQAYSMCQSLKLAMDYGGARAQPYALYILARPDVLLVKDMVLASYASNSAWVNCWATRPSSLEPDRYFNASRHGPTARADLLFTLNAASAHAFRRLYHGNMSFGMHNSIPEHMFRMGIVLKEDDLCGNDALFLVLLMGEQIRAHPDRFSLAKYGIGPTEVLGYCGQNRTLDGEFARDCNRLEERGGRE